METATEQQLFKKTGAPIHAAYAVAQLRVLYQERSLSSVTDQIVQWHTLPSLCLSRWRRAGTVRRRDPPQGVVGENENEGDDADIPISYSEASWTGLLNYHSCQYEPTMLDLLPESCVKALPKLADFDDDAWWRRQQLPPPPSSSSSSSGTATMSPNDDCWWRRQQQQQLPISSSSSSASSFLGPLYANRWPMLQKARFFLGIGDGACANVGSKCWTPNRIACTVGTSAAARICLPLETISSSGSGSSTASINNTCHVSRDIPSGLFCYRIDKSHVLVGGALTDGGSVVEWTTQLLNLLTDDDNDDRNHDNKRRTLRNCMDQVKGLLEADYNDQDGNSCSSMLVAAPFLSGERSTGYRSGATGAMLGLTRDTTPAHFLKANMEGVTLRILAIVQLLLQCIPNLAMTSLGGEGGGGIVKSCHDQERPIIMASGQALEVNGLWRQMIADSTDMDVVWDESTQEGTSRGVACLVAMALSASLLSTEQAARRVDDNDKSIPSAGRLSYLREEAVDRALVTIASPRGANAKKYWERAAASQNDLIQALSQLYSKEEA
jgi:gluconokinase